LVNSAQDSVLHDKFKINISTVLNFFKIRYSIFYQGDIPKMSDVNHDRFTGFADIYDAFRPRPPVAAVKIILSMTGLTKIDAVADIGCGTGLSSLMWTEYADKIIGIEPNDDMRNQAIKINAHEKIEYVKGDSAVTGLLDASVSIVCCSQSFHWMEPVTSLAECTRILKPGGVFMTIDNDWPPVVDWRAEKAYDELFEAVDGLTKKYSSKLPVHKKWAKAKHLENMVNSGHFTFCREIVFHSVEECDAERFIHLALSQGGLQVLLQSGIDDINKYVDSFSSQVRQSFSVHKKEMTIPYRMRCGIRKNTE
jgi:ubiquinone/menaquinone biosynthesis C-methylase UbiE